jgi:hypothetical protein
MPPVGGPTRGSSAKSELAQNRTRSRTWSPDTVRLGSPASNHCLRSAQNVWSGSAIFRCRRALRGQTGLRRFTEFGCRLIWDSSHISLSLRRRAAPFAAGGHFSIKTAFLRLDCGSAQTNFGSIQRNSNNLNFTASYPPPIF